MNILLVDDKMENLYLLETLLNGNGHRTTTVGNGKEALDWLAVEKPDLIISDILMPEMDGYTFCRSVKNSADLAKIPFVFYTATYTDEKDKELALSLGADCFLVKPMLPENFLKSIQALIKDAKAGKIVPKKPRASNEENMLLYNARLVAKLEKKILELESEAKSRREAEKALRASEKRYKSLFNDAPIPLWEEDFSELHLYLEKLKTVGVQDFRAYFDDNPDEIKVCAKKIKTINVNQAALDLHQAKFKDELLGSLNKIFTPKSYDTLKKKIIDIAYGEQHFEAETEVRTLTGETRQIFLLLKVEHRSAKTYRALLATKDITARKKAEFELKEAESLYKSFFDEDLSGDYITDIEGHILTCNPEFLRIFHFASVEEARSTNIVSLYRSPEIRMALLKNIQKEKKLLSTELRMRRQDGEPAEILANIFGIFNKDDELIQMKGYLFDNTERHLLQEQLLQAQKMESLGTLASGIAHDFNNILGIIMGHSGLMEINKSNPDELTRSIEAIKVSTQRGAALVRQLLTFARKSDLSEESVQINDSIQEIVELVHQTFPKTIKTSSRMEKDLPPLTADSTQIHQILINLCINARDAMPEGGALTISSKKISQEKLLSIHPNAGATAYIELHIGDTGSGMDKTTLKKIFDPFFTTKDVGKGTGLGLAMVYGIITSHHGFIDVYSKPGIGTDFYIYLPVSEHSQAFQATKSMLANDIPGGTETILIIEDEPAIKDFLTSMLKPKGYSVLLAKDGQEAIEVYAAHHADIAVVLCDVGLPKLGGEVVFRKIREIDSSAKVILASGYIDPELKTNLYESGLCEFIQKPYTIEDVLQKIRDVIDVDE